LCFCKKILKKIKQQIIRKIWSKKVDFYDRFLIRFSIVFTPPFLIKKRGQKTPFFLTTFWPSFWMVFLVKKRGPKSIKNDKTVYIFGLSMIKWRKKVNMFSVSLLILIQNRSKIDILNRPKKSKKSIDPPPGGGGGREKNKI